MTLTLTPSSHLMMIGSSACEVSDVPEYTHFSAEKIAQAFAHSQSAGIMALAGGKSAPDGPLFWMFWRDFGTRYLTALFASARKRTSWCGKFQKAKPDTVVFLCSRTKCSIWVTGSRAREPVNHELDYK